MYEVQSASAALCGLAEVEVGRTHTPCSDHPDREVIAISQASPTAAQLVQLHL
jgi:hypothetical protein